MKFKSDIIKVMKVCGQIPSSSVQNYVSVIDELQ